MLQLCSCAAGEESREARCWPTHPVVTEFGPAAIWAPFGNYSALLQTHSKTDQVSGLADPPLPSSGNLGTTHCARNRHAVHSGQGNKPDSEDLACLVAMENLFYLPINVHTVHYL